MLIPCFEFIIQMTDLRPFLSGSCLFWIPALDHEMLDDTMENQTIIVALLAA
jgi:hypothetical protein